MKSKYFLLVVCLILLVSGSRAALAQAPTVDGLVTVQGGSSVDETVSQLQSTIQDRGLILLSTVDHAANAQGVGQELRPTQLIIFGNPNLGSQLMQNQQSVAIDLPQKFLVWENEAGEVNVSYNDPQYLQNRHNLSGPEDVLATISTALGGLSSSVLPVETTAEAASGTEGEAPAASETETAAEAESTTPADSPPTTLPTSGADRSASPWWLFGAGLLLISAGWLMRRRGWSKLFFLVATPLLLTVFTQPGVTAQETNGLISVDSPYSVEETINRLQTTMEERGLTVMTTINHGANAENVGLELRPTQLIIFGNPNLGTQLMQSSQTVAIDLPQKFLVWEDADGQVHMAYNDPQYLAQRHGITDRDDVLATIANALNGLAEAAGAP